jgi:hypothetical protein
LEVAISQSIKRCYIPNKRGWRVGVRNFLVGIFLLLALSHGQALAADGLFPQVNEVRLGGTLSGTADAQVLFSPLPVTAKSYDRNFAWLLVPRPLVGVSVSLEGKTSQAYAGLVWTVPIYGRFFAELSAGALIHDQTLGHIIPTAPRPYRRDFCSESRLPSDIRSMTTGRFSPSPTMDRTAILATGTKVQIVLAYWWVELFNPKSKSR